MSSNQTCVKSLRVEWVGRFVRLRPLLVGDSELTLRWRLGGRAQLLHLGATTVLEQTEWIRSRPDNELNFVVETKDKSPVGTVSLVGIDLVNRRAEPGRFLIGEERLCRGIPVALESLLMLYSLAFDELRLRRLWGTIADGNPILGWHKYFGWVEEGRLRSHELICGRYRDLVIIGASDFEYRQFILPRMTRLLPKKAVD